MHVRFEYRLGNRYILININFNQAHWTGSNLIFNRIVTMFSCCPVLFIELQISEISDGHMWSLKTLIWKNRRVIKKKSCYDLWNRKRACRLLTNQTLFPKIACVRNLSENGASIFYMKQNGKLEKTVNVEESLKQHRNRWNTNKIL